MNTICKTCRHLGEAAASAEFREHYLSCRWPVPAIPSALHWPELKTTEAARGIPRKQIEDPAYKGPTITSCPTFELRPE